MIETINQYLERKNLYFVPRNGKNIVYYKPPEFEYTFIPYELNPNELYIQICQETGSNLNLNQSSGSNLNLINISLSTIPTPNLTLLTHENFFVYERIIQCINQKIFRNISLKKFETPIVEYYNYLYFGKLNLKVYKTNTFSCRPKIRDICIELALTKDKILNLTNLTNLAGPLIFTTKSCKDNILETNKNCKIISDSNQIESIISMINNISISHIHGYYCGLLNGQKIYIQVPDWLIDMYIN